jgi:hypothetical protein
MVRNLGMSHKGNHIFTAIRLDRLFPVPSGSIRAPRHCLTLLLRDRRTQILQFH